MILLFLYTFIQSSTIPMTINWPLITINGIIALIFWFVKSQSDRRYTEQKELKEQVRKNEKQIAANTSNDEKAEALLEKYQEQMREKNDSLQKTLEGINESLNKFNDTTQNLAIQVAKLEEKLKEESK